MAAGSKKIKKDQKKITQPRIKKQIKKDQKENKLRLRVRKLEFWYVFGTRSRTLSHETRVDVLKLEFWKGFPGTIDDPPSHTKRISRRENSSFCTCSKHDRQPSHTKRISRRLNSSFGTLFPTRSTNIFCISILILLIFMFLLISILL